MFSKTLLLFFLVYFSSNFAHGRDKKFFREDYSYLETTEGFYKIHMSRKTWDEAKRVCALEGASFFYPDNREEANAVTSFWKNTQPDVAWAFVGMSDILSEGVFVTVDGKSVNEVYNRWQLGEPNDLGGNENCVQLSLQGRLNDVTCYEKSYFICKKSLQKDGQKNLPCFRKDYTYIEAGESFYKIHMTKKNWRDAKRECALEGASLFYPENSDEANAVISFWTLYQNNTVPRNTWVFVGISDIITEGVYETIDGKSIYEVYSNWCSSQPDNSGDEDCVHLNQKGEINDIKCDVKYSFICKKSLSSLDRNSSCNILQSNLDGQKNRVSFRKDYTYIEAGESFYKIHMTEKNWRDAKQECALEGASLFYPENRDEANAVISFWTLYQNNTVPRNTWVFVGISDIITEGVYETIDGQSISEVYSNWCSSQPDNSGDEDCVHLNQKGKINDIKCDAEYSFICKKSLSSLERNSSSNILQSNLDGQKNRVSFRKDYTYIKAGESFYKIHMTEKNWRDAKRECALEGASLFYPENSDEANAVISFWTLYQNNTVPRNTWVFVGISDIITEGVYETIDGQSISEVYSNWYSSQPDNSGDEDCVHLNQIGEINDINCVAEYSFICKKSLSSLERNSSSNILQSNLDGQKKRVSFRKDYTYIEAGESFYKIHMTEKNWRDAKQECALEGASLFYPENSDEANAVISFWTLYQNNTVPRNTWVFVGISDIITEGVYETIDGKSISEVYSNWCSSQPDNSGDEDCVHLNQKGKINDIKCDAEYSFICKKSLSSLNRSSSCHILHSNLDYTVNNSTGKCYKLHTTPLKWAESNIMCQIEYSSLAVISSRMEADYLADLTKSTPIPRINEQYQRGIYHLGFHNRFNEGWQTVRGTPMILDADAWFNNYQPDRSQYEECGSMFYTGRLINTDCNTKSFFICEHEIDSSN